MLSKLTSGFAAFCVATVLTQVILLGFFLVRGSLNSDTATKMIALLNGIDISGNRLQLMLQNSQDREQPDFDEILDARRLKSYDMDMRLRSERLFRDELSTMQAELKDERDRLDERQASFRRELKEIERGAKETGLLEVQRTLQSLEAAQAKDQLLIMYEDERIDDVVTIVQAMSTENRKDILAEFVSKEDSDKLAEILRRIGDGMPVTSVIDDALQDR